MNVRFDEIANLIKNDIPLKGKETSKDIILDALRISSHIFSGKEFNELKVNATINDVKIASLKTTSLLKTIYNNVDFSAYEKEESFVVIYQIGEEKPKDKEVSLYLRREQGTYYDKNCIVVTDTKDLLSYSNTHAVLMADKIFAELVEFRYLSRNKPK